MKLHKLIVKEILQRNNQLISSLLAIVLGIAVVVGINNITIFSEKAVSEELGALGANILILPKSSSIQDYYSADFQEQVIPESYLQTLVSAKINGIDNLSPKLSMETQVQGHDVILTGIIPQNEIQSKALWSGNFGVFSKGPACSENVKIPGVDDNKKSPQRRVIKDLDRNAVIVGSEIAGKLNLQEKETIQIHSDTYTVEAILPTTGKVDDSRIFTHLSVVQELSNQKGLLNTIEIVGCCTAITEGLIVQLNKLLPDAKVVTINQIVQTQVKTNRMMKQLSNIMFIIILIVSCAIITNLMFANVYERRKEIGTYMALGATSGWIGKIFVLKSLLVGLAGGILGYIVGSLLAIVFGPQITGVSVLPLPELGIYSLIISVVISLIASIIPAWKATKVDPFIILKEN